MAPQTAEQWVSATVRFTNRWGGKGSGFLVERQDENDHPRTFFVTNKDLVKRDPVKRARARYLILHLNVRQLDGTLVGKDYECSLTDSLGGDLWREHDERDTDVYAVDVTSLYDSHSDVIANRAVPYRLLADAKELAHHNIGIGGDILVIGYPDAFYLGHPGNLNLPIARQGIIATGLDGVFETRTEIRGLPIIRLCRGFMVDVGTLRGSGGGPVVLRPNGGGRTEDNSLPPFLVGIVAETRFTMEDSVKFSGLGFAFGTESVRETVDRFFA